MSVDALGAAGLDPTLALAFAMHATPGAYALLLGSGLSASAGIPTGWAITLDLTRRLAAAMGPETAAAAASDPEAWYRTAIGSEPDYSTLIERLAPTPAGRRELLKHYFEPGPDDADTKRPTRAHRAIARLVRGKYVRVIVTTNFDQLLEVALEAEGVRPAVLRTPDALAGAMPLHAEGVTVIKLHGDYLDTRILNTPSELSAYAPDVDRRLDQVFDEYGLVVCGWSASWDDALRSALERCPTRRFLTVWAAKGPVSPAAEALIAHRRASVVPIDSADAFFESLAEKVEALAEFGRAHPASTAVAVATAKRYVPAPEHHIRLHDLVITEADSVRARATAIATAPPPPLSAENAVAVARRYEGIAETLAGLLATVTYFGRGEHRSVVRKALALAATPGNSLVNGFTTWINMRRSPAQLAWYAAGLGAVAADDDDTLAYLLLTPLFVNPEGGMMAGSVALHSTAVLDEHAKAFYANRRAWPTSERLHEVLRPALRDALPGDRDYDEAFDRFEFLVGLAYAGLTYPGEVPQHMWLPLGRYVRRRHYGGQPLAEAMDREVASAGLNWILLKHGLFDGDLARVRAMIVKATQLGARPSLFG